MRLNSLFSLLLVLLLTACATSPYSQEGRDISNGLIRKQLAVANQQIATEPVSVIYAGFALHNGTTAFQGDIVVSSALIQRMTKANVQLMFSNAQGAGKPKLPYATEYDVGLGVAATAALAEGIRKRTDKAPLVVVLLTSHGITDNLIVNAAGDNLRLTTDMLARDFRVLEKFPTLLIISACHSGSLIPALRHENRIIITATSADRVSFGCQPGSERTWFVDSLIKAYDPAYTVRQWYEATAQTVGLREKEKGYKASQPQLWVGKNMRGYAATPISLLAEGKLTAAPVEPEPATAPVTQGEPAKP